MFPARYDWLICLDVAISHANATITDFSHRPSNLSGLYMLPELEATTMTLRLMTLAAFAPSTLDDTSGLVRSKNIDVFRRWMEAGFVEAEWIIRLAALVSCGLGVYAYEWSKGKFSPAMFEFRGKRLWALISPAVLRMHRLCDFFLVEADKHPHIQKEAFILLARQRGSPSLYTRCLCTAESTLAG
jgi:hypothetical protein